MYRCFQGTRSIYNKKEALEDLQEVAAPVLDPVCRQRLATVLQLELADPAAWELAADGSYHQRVTLPIGDPSSAQAAAMASRTEDEAVWAG